MKGRSSALGSGLVILSGVFWGSMGLFVRRLSAYGFSSLQITSIRLCLAALVFCLILLFKDRGGFRVQPMDIPLFLGLGLLSVLFFTLCYFTAISMMPLSTAAILLYTSPIWVMLMSVLFFTRRSAAGNCWRWLWPSAAVCWSPGSPGAASPSKGC